MKQLSPLRSLLGLLLLACIALTLQPSCDPQPKPVPADSTFLGLTERSKDPAFQSATAELEKKTGQAVSNMKKLGVQGLPHQIVTVPVVVHVVRTGSMAEVPQSLIEQQIAALNRDFRRRNKDEIAALPEVFRLLAADTRIQFALAQSDPKRAATNGIQVVQSQRKEPFDYQPAAPSPQERNPVKFAKTGGSDAWPAQQCLNIWVCDLAPALGEGYASLPADLAARPEEDGIVVDVQYFGFAAANREKGHTLTNLAAKWMGLKDIWGTGVQSGSDDVDDTPPQDGPNTGQLAYPLGNSTDKPYGEMFVNFMDASSDQYRAMFTTGQADRMYAGMRYHRDGIGNGSQYAFPPGGPMPAGGGADYMTGDFGADVGTEPSGPGAYYQSPDIIIEHGGVVDVDPVDNELNIVRVRVENIGLADGTATNPVTSISLYWANPSTSGTTWPCGWTLISTQLSTGISVGLSHTFNFSWTPPAVDAGVPESDARRHYCLLAVMEPKSSGPLHSAGGCTIAVSELTRNNNDVAWKNVTLVEPSQAPNPGGQQPPRMAGVFFGPTPGKPSSNQSVQMHFKVPAGEEAAFDYGTVRVNSPRLRQLWIEGGRKGTGVELQDSMLVIQSDNAMLDNLLMNPGERASLQLQFVANDKTSPLRTIYALNVEQYEELEKGKGYTAVGGQAFVLQDERTDKFPPPPAIQNGGGKNSWLGQNKNWLVGLLIVLIGGAVWYFRKK